VGGDEATGARVSAPATPVDQVQMIIRLAEEIRALRDRQVQLARRVAELEAQVTERA
jgi:hypothetical protein